VINELYVNGNEILVGRDNVQAFKICSCYGSIDILFIQKDLIECGSTLALSNTYTGSSVSLGIRIDQEDP